VLLALASEQLPGVGGRRGTAELAVIWVVVIGCPFGDIGDTCSEKAFSSQRALSAPLGDTSQQKNLRYQQTVDPF
jgi:hypothetical protein